MLSIAQGGASEDSGLSKGDTVIKIGQTEVKGMDMAAIGRLLEGSAGTKLTITARRQHTAEEFNIEVVRTEPSSAVGKALEEAARTEHLTEFVHVPVKLWQITDLKATESGFGAGGGTSTKEYCVRCRAQRKHKPYLYRVYTTGEDESLASIADKNDCYVEDLFEVNTAEPESELEQGLKRFTFEYSNKAMPMDHQLCEKDKGGMQTRPISRETVLRAHGFRFTANAVPSDVGHDQTPACRSPSPFLSHPLSILPSLSRVLLFSLPLLQSLPLSLWPSHTGSLSPSINLTPFLSPSLSFPLSLPPSRAPLSLSLPPSPSRWRTLSLSLCRCELCKLPAETRVRILLCYRVDRDCTETAMFTCLTPKDSPWCIMHQRIRITEWLVQACHSKAVMEGRVKDCNTLFRAHPFNLSFEFEEKITSNGGKEVSMNGPTAIRFNRHFLLLVDLLVPANHSGEAQRLWRSRMLKLWEQWRRYVSIPHCCVVAILFSVPHLPS